MRSRSTFWESGAAAIASEESWACDANGLLQTTSAVRKAERKPIGGISRQIAKGQKTKGQT